MRRSVGRGWLGMIGGVALTLALGCEPPPDETAELISSATVPAGFTDSVIVSGLASPTSFALAPDGRLFVAEQGGTLRVVQNGVLLEAPFLRVTVDSAGERGLIGVTLDPAFASNGYVYVFYTALTPTVHNRVSRFTANGNVAVAGSEVIIVDLDTLGRAVNHNGGAIHFGADGRLYVGVGDNTVSANSQSMATRLGKVLRLNADGTIPTDNPFYTTATGANRAIWALGVRNPFTFGVHPRTGRIFINDVGNTAFEEINDLYPGANYGWPTTEGPSSDARFRAPVFSYGHGDGATTGCAIAGGAFYDPPTPQFPSTYVGKYFFSDLCSGWIRTIDPANNFAVAGFASDQRNTVDLLVHPDGSLYLLDHILGTVHRISSTAGQPPSITQQPAAATVPLGGSATFTTSAGGSSPLTFQWQRNGANIAGATSASYTLAGALTADSGASFRCVVSNPFGTATTSAATLTVTSNTPPTVTITSPRAGLTYAGGDVLTFAATGTDREDGALPAAAFTWWIDFHHDTHTHPAMPETRAVASGTFQAGTRGEVSANVWYRVYVRATDSGGLTTETFADIHPRTVTMTLASVPSGLQVTLDGQPVTTPYTFTGVEGVIRSVGAVTPQTSGATTYTFQSWSDGRGATHDITTPPAATTYTVTYQGGTTVATRTGLRGTYYDDEAFRVARGQRTDASVSFNWGTAAPVAGVAAETFSVRWTGFVTAPATGTYTFSVSSDEGARLWVDGRIVVDDFAPHAFRERTGTVSLTAGRPTALHLDYFDRSGAARVELRWSSPTVTRQVIPQASLSW